MTDGDDTRAKFAAWFANRRVVGALVPNEFDYDNADALLRDFPVLTTEPNETTRPSAIDWLDDSGFDLNRDFDRYHMAVAFNAGVAAVLAVAPTNPTDEPDDEEISSLWRNYVPSGPLPHPDGLRAIWQEGANYADIRASEIGDTPWDREAFKTALAAREPEIPDLQNSIRSAVVPAEREETTETTEATPDRLAHYLSEWLDDQAPMHERSLYRMVAVDMGKKFSIIQRHDDSCPLHILPSSPIERCTCGRAVAVSTKDTETKK